MSIARTIGMTVALGTFGCIVGVLLGTAAGITVVLITSLLELGANAAITMRASAALLGALGLMIGAYSGYVGSKARARAATSGSTA